MTHPMPAQAGMGAPERLSGFPRPVERKGKCEHEASDARGVEPGSPYRYAWEGEGFASWAKTAPPP